jgi:hypothetical protein
MLSAGPAHAVKLCGRWISSPCTYGSVNADCNAITNYCSCLFSGCGQSYWGVVTSVNCKDQNGVLACFYICANTIHSTTVTSFPNAAAVTCPASGECGDTNYKTVGNSDSCGDGWEETTSPALTISGEYSNNAGTFTYGECTK